MNRLTWVAVAALLTIPFIGLLSVPLYARADPQLGAFPFFYWYQMAWVPLSAGCTALAYVLVRRHERARRQRRDGGER